MQTCKTCKILCAGRQPRPYVKGDSPGQMCCATAQAFGQMPRNSPSPRGLGELKESLKCKGGIENIQTCGRQPRPYVQGDSPGPMSCATAQALGQMPRILQAPGGLENSRSH